MLVTMSNYRLIPSEFDGVPVDMVLLDDMTVGFTTHHLSQVFETSESYLNQVIQRNFELFDDSTFDCKMQSNGRMKTFKCLKKDGVVILITLLDYKGYPPEKKQRIVNFRKWSAKVTTDVMEGKIDSDLIRWLAERKLSKMLYHNVTDTVQQYLIPKNASKDLQRKIYGREANFMNLAIFGKKANGVNRRDTSSIEELSCMNQLQIKILTLIADGITPETRLLLLKELAQKQLKVDNEQMIEG